MLSLAHFILNRISIASSGTISQQDALTPLEAAFIAGSQLADSVVIFNVNGELSSVAEEETLQSKASLGNFVGGKTSFAVHPSPTASSELYRLASEGKLVAAYAPIESLIQAIPHLYRIAAEGIPVVIHVIVGKADHAAVAAVAQTGFAVVASSTVQDAYNVAVAAHATAVRTSVPFLHLVAVGTTTASSTIVLVDGAVSHKIIPSDVLSAYRTKYAGASREPASATAVPLQPVSAEASRLAFSAVGAAFTETLHALKLDKAIPFQYYGPTSPKTVIVGIAAEGLVDAATNAKFGVVSVRVYRPFDGKAFAAAIPAGVTRVVVVDRTDGAPAAGGLGEGWGQLFLDVSAAALAAPTLSSVAFYSAHVTADALSDAIVAAVAEETSKDAPSLQFAVGKNSVARETGVSHGPASQSTLPYFRMLAQAFGDRLLVADARGHATVWGESSPLPNTPTPEFGYGVHLAAIKKRARVIDTATQIAANPSIGSEQLRTALRAWVAVAHRSADSQQNKAVKEVELLVAAESESHPLIRVLGEQLSLLRNPSRWLVGGEEWGHDIFFSGVHHVIASGEKVNLLIVDTELYGARDQALPARPKRDIGLYAMNYGGAYVASVAVYSSYTQVLRAFIEADSYPGPAVVLAYMPNAKPEANEGSNNALAALRQTKVAVDSGTWPLYRFDPSLEKTGREPFSLDSERIKADLEKFLDRHNHLSEIVRSQPKFDPALASSVEAEVARRREEIENAAVDSYRKLLGGLNGPSRGPLLILFGSDGGNAEKLAKRIDAQAKKLNFASKVSSMNNFGVEALKEVETVVFTISTAGQGEFPTNAREFWKQLVTASASTPGPLASKTKFAVFGLGDKHYWPRPEDAHFYCKAPKDLDARLEASGASRILPIGLGDDQDPEGYETGFKAWIPELWKSLGVTEVVDVSAAPTLTDDQMKINSNYLRGTIAKGLLDETTGALAELDTKIIKFHGSYQQDDRDIREERAAMGLENAFSFMIRVRVPGGIATPAQYLAMDDIAGQYANGTIKLTTRQAFQLHGVVKKELRATIRAINQTLMDTLAACGDVNRNVMCNPLPVLSELHAAAYEFSKQLSAHLSPRTSAYHEIWLDDKQVAGNAVVDVEPLYGPTYLPRKFKIGVAIPPNNDIDVFSQDLGYIAIKGEDGKLAGFNVAVGGGMGMTHNNKKTFPRLGDVLGFCTFEQALDVGEKVMLVQRDFGDRTNRKHARLKYTIEDNGLEWFKERVEEKLGYKLDPARPYKFADNGDRYGWTEGEDGKWHLGLYIEGGRVKDTPEIALRTALREVAQVHKGDFRLTGNQNIMIGNVDAADKASIDSILAKYGVGNGKHSGMRLNSMACVALPTCGLAFAEAERYLPSLIGHLEVELEKAGLRDDAITIRMTGCPNGCARPYISEIAFVGKAPGTYNVYLGGGFAGDRLNKLYKESQTEEQIIAELSPIFHRYAKERKDATEHFGDFVIRAGYVKAVLAGREFHD